MISSTTAYLPKVCPLSISNDVKHRARRLQGLVAPRTLTSASTPLFASASSSSTDTNNNNHQHPFSHSSSSALNDKVSNSSTPDDISTEVNSDNDVAVLPMEPGSHGSSRIRIPAALTTPDTHDNVESDPFSPIGFRDRLHATIAACRALSKSALWIEVPLSRSSLLPDMAALGFRYHHAVHDTAVLNLWLGESESKIPDFATHHVGVGAVVVNSRDDILVVRELRRNYMPWKTPTGLSELGEPLDQAAEREVWEETGIRATFHSVLGFRQTHGLAHGRSDLFFVCRLDPVEEVDSEGRRIIPMPVPQANEIEKAEWVPLSEYRAMVNANDNGHPMMSHVMAVFDAGRRIERKVVNSIVPGRAPNAIFYPSMDIHKP
jgi:8-oxo-dGTP pyrophosphatase MutT (NUDIX family)